MSRCDQPPGDLPLHAYTEGSIARRPNSQHPVSRDSMARKKNKQAQKDKKETREKKEQAAKSASAAAEVVDPSVSERAGKKHHA